MRLLCLLIALSIFFPVSLLSTYYMAASNGHVTTEGSFAFISDTGASAPESCFFSQQLNIAAVMFGLVIYFRYLQVENYIQNQFLPPPSHYVNKLLLFFGLTAALGVSIASNFQTTRLPQGHAIGAFLLFCAPVFYCSLDLIFICFQTQRRALIPMWVAMARLGVGLFYVADGITFVTCAFISRRQYMEAHPDGGFFSEASRFEGLTPFRRTDAGWTLFAVACVAEWIIALLVVSFLLTFACEFSEFELVKLQLLPTSKVKSKHDEADAAAVVKLNNGACTALL